MHIYIYIYIYIYIFTYLDLISGTHKVWYKSPTTSCVHGVTTKTHANTCEQESVCVANNVLCGQHVKKTHTTPLDNYTQNYTHMPYSYTYNNVC